MRSLAKDAQREGQEDYEELSVLSNDSDYLEDENIPLPNFLGMTDEELF